VADEYAAQSDAVSLNLEAVRERLSDAARILTQLGPVPVVDDDDGDDEE
jgi:hypothetical protein